MEPTPPAPDGTRHDLAGRTGRLAFAALVAGALAIAFSPTFVKLSELGPQATAFYRVALAFPLLLAWMQFADGPRAARRQPTRRDYGLLALAGLFWAGDLGTWHLALVYTSVANSTFLANLAPIFVTAGAFLLFRERVSMVFLLGLALGIGGAALLIGPNLDAAGDAWLGDMISLGTAFFYGAYIITVGRLRRAFTTATIMTWSGGVSALALLALALLSGEGFIAETAFGRGILLALAWFAHAGGQSLIAYGLAFLPASFSSVSLLVQPVAAAIIAWALLGEALGWLQAMGGAVVLCGIYICRTANRSRQ